MDDSEEFNKTSLPEKEGFYSHLDMEDITDAYYKHAKRVCKAFEIKNLWEYHDLYVRDYALLLADVFQGSQNICLKRNNNMISLVFLLRQYQHCKQL